MARTRPPPWAPVAPTTAMIFFSAIDNLLVETQRPRGGVYFPSVQGSSPRGD
jgi:hypothetical protein